MDELEALRILRGESAVEKPEENEKPPKKRTSLPAAVLVILIIFGYLAIFVLTYLSGVHPMDRILIKMAVLKNYTVTMTVHDQTSTVIVDDNVVFDGYYYYETVGDRTYKYYVDSAGRWQRTSYSTDTTASGVDDSLITTLLDKDSYWPKLIRIGKYRMWDNLRPNEINGITATVVFGRFNANGYVLSQQWHGLVRYSVHVRISDFGRSKLTLPTPDEKVK